jgi:replication factor C subunit 1
VDKLLTWVKDWQAVVLKGEKKDIVVRGGRFDPQRNVNARAVLISGPPGIGKTTAARLVAKALGYRAIEMNASDVRSKSALEPIRAASQNVGLAGEGLVKAIVIMDEVDGMAGGDRGGIGYIMDIIRQATIPIICICNDRGSSKLRSLVNICYDLRFIRPNKAQISSRLLAISAYEGLSIEPNALDRLIESSGHDIRQIFTSLELVSRTSTTLTYKDLRLQESKSTKDNCVMIGAFDAAAGLLRRGEVKARKLWENLGLFFVDFDLVPLLVHENCLSAVGEHTSPEDLSKVCDSIAMGDVISRKIHQDNEWSLLPLYGLFSSILPGYFCSSGVAFPRFSEWFGRNSTQKRKERLLRELKQAMSQYPSASDSQDLISHGIPLLFRLLLEPLETLGKDAVDDVLETMYEYSLTPEMLKEHLIDLQISEHEDPERAYKDLPAAVKSALTRVFNLYNPNIKGGKRRAAETNSDQKDRFDPEIEEKVEERSETEGEEEEMKTSSSTKKKRGKGKGKQGKSPKKQ